MTETRGTRRGYVAKLVKQIEKSGDDVIEAWKTGARRPDRVGDVSYRSLELLHRGASVAARSLGRLERATQPPGRPPAPAVQAPDEPDRAGRAHPAPRRGADKPGSGATGS